MDRRGHVHMVMSENLTEPDLRLVDALRESPLWTFD
jgi:hypothetical protein